MPLILSSIICDGQSLDGFSVYIQTQTYTRGVDSKAVSPIHQTETAASGMAEWKQTLWQNRDTADGVCYQVGNTSPPRKELQVLDGEEGCTAKTRPQQ